MKTSAPSTLWFHVRRAFSLVEMLVVITILVAIFLIAAPAVSSVVQANRLTAAGGQVLSLMALAQQIAVVEGRPVEVRFVQYMAVGATVPYYQTVVLSRYYAVGEIGPDGRQVTSNGISVLAADPIILPSGIVIADQMGISNILANPLLRADSSDTSNLGNLEVYSGGSLKPYAWASNANQGPALKYCSVIIRPNGTSLPDPTQNWYFTLIDESKYAVASDITSINNFYTIAIDPINGHATSYRP